MQFARSSNSSSVNWEFKLELGWPDKKKKLGAPSIRVDNIEQGATVHQRCIIVEGTSQIPHKEGDYVQIDVWDIYCKGLAKTVQTWPVVDGSFRAMVALFPGENEVMMQLRNNGDFRSGSCFTVNYVPHTQTPPLHLAIMVAKDSPLLMDCPPERYAGISSTHNSLDAAVAKFRTTALMWQAMMAEDFRAKGFGRRCFRIEEEPALDTTQLASYTMHSHSRDEEQYLGSTPKVHVIRSERTVKELNNYLRGDDATLSGAAVALHHEFERALDQHGKEDLRAEAKPVIVGMIFDLHWTPGTNQVPGIVPWACHNPDGRSLTTFGSQLVYTWPRFVQEVMPCLTDNTSVGPGGGAGIIIEQSHEGWDDERSTMWEACSLSQGNVLQFIARSFGAGVCGSGSGDQYTLGPRASMLHWAGNFLRETSLYRMANEQAWCVVEPEVFAKITLSNREAQALVAHPHFRLPSVEEKASTLPATHGDNTIALAAPVVRNAGRKGFRALLVECPAGIYDVQMRGADLDAAQLFGNAIRLHVDCQHLDDSVPLPLQAIGCNGRVTFIRNVWDFFPTFADIKPTIDFPVWHKSVRANFSQLEDGDAEKESQTQGLLDWAVLLNTIDKEGKMHRATAISLCVGDVLDGVVVHYANGTSINCAPAQDRQGGAFRVGGKKTERLEIPEGVTIAKIEINNGLRTKEATGFLKGIRVTLSNGAIAGELNVGTELGAETAEEKATPKPSCATFKSRPPAHIDDIEILIPMPGQKICGFYGRNKNGRNAWSVQFGIHTGPSGGSFPRQLPVEAFKDERLWKIDARVTRSD